MRVHREAVVAVVLLLLCGAFFAATFMIRETSYGTIGSELWPRMVIVVLAFFTAVHLIASLRAEPEERAPDEGLRARREGFYATYRNPIWSFATFAVFLVALPYLGMLIGGVLFVFATLSILGEHDGRSLAIHGVIALATVGAMWAIFTFALHVILPEGEIVRFW